MNQSIGQRIAYQRKQKGMSQEDLANLVNVSRQAVSKWESDVSLPDIDRLIKICKLFDVSVGWLLGVEQESMYDLTDSHIETIEAMFAKYQSKPRRHVLIPLITLFLVFAMIGQFIYFNIRISRLQTENQNLNDKLLSSDNSSVATTAPSSSTVVDNTDKKLLKDVKLQAYIDDELETVTIKYYLTPRVYIENNSANLLVENNQINFEKTFSGIWNPYTGNYIVEFTVPAVDGYNITLLFVNEYGYEETTELMADVGIEHLGSICTFHLSPSDPIFKRIQSGTPSDWPSANKHYTFDNEIHSPHIFTQTAVSYKYIKIQLVLNGESIYEMDYLDAFYEATNGKHLNTGDNSVHPDITVELPEIKSGDEIKLILTAQTVNGGAATQSYESLLDYWIVT